ncbi:MAG: choice-of-anchor D domain-containing protein [Terracidiphilus sp.]
MFLHSFFPDLFFRSHDPQSLRRRNTCSLWRQTGAFFAFGLACALALLLFGCGASLTIAPGHDALTVTPGTIAFGSLPVGSSAKADVTLVNQTFSAVEINSVTTSGKYFSLLNNVNVPVRVPAGGSYHLTVAFTPTQAGAASGDLIVSTNLTSSARSTVPLSGQATKSTTVTPSSAQLTINATSASFGDVAVNTTATQSLTLTSTGSTAVSITSTTVNGAAFTSSGFIAPATLPPGQSVTINVQFHPTTPGAATGALVINSNSSANNTLSLPLNGSGVAQLVQLIWNAPANSGSSGIAGYRIYRAVNGTAQFQLLNASLTASTVFADASVTTGQSYDYYVTAVDNTGAESTPSNTATVAIPGA